MKEEVFFVDFCRTMVVSSRLLKCLGLWPESSNSFFACDFNTSWFVFVFVSCNYLYALQVAYFFLGCSDFGTAGILYSLIFEMLVTNIKVFTIIRFHAMAKRFMAECNSKIFQPKTREQTEQAEEVINFYKWSYLVFWIAGTVALFGCMCYPLLGQRDQVMLPLIVWYPYNYTDNFWPTYFQQVLVGAAVNQTHVNVDGFSMGFLAFIIAQCGILEDTIKNLKDITKISLEASGRIHVDHKEFVSEIEKQFYACIQHHKEILRWFQEIYHMFSLMIVCQFITSTLTVSMTLVQARLLTPTDPKFIAMALFSSAVLAQLLQICWWGNEVSSKSSQIPTAIFISDWMEMSPKTKKDVLTCIHHTQAPMELFGADYFKASLQNFMLILKHTYSFYAVLHSVST